MRPTILLLLLLTATAAATATAADDGFDELEQLAALWSVADEPFKPVTRELEDPPFRHQKVLSVTAASMASGWVPNRQCHRNFPLFPALQISFRPDAVRNMAIVEHGGGAEAWVEEPTIQMKNTRPENTLCFTSENNTLVFDEASGEYLLTVGPYYLKLFDGYFPLDVDLTVDYPDDLRFTGMEPATVDGADIRFEDGRIRFAALFEGRLKLVFRFRPS